MKKLIKLKNTSLIPKDIQSNICFLTRFSVMKVSYLKFKIKFIIIDENGNESEYSLGKPCALNLNNKYERIFCKFYLMNKFYTLDLDLSQKYKKCYLSMEYVIITPIQHFHFVNKYLPNFKQEYLPKPSDLQELFGRSGHFLEKPFDCLNSKIYLEYLEEIIFLSKNIYGYDYLNIQSKVWLSNNSNRIITYPVTKKVILDLNNQKDIEAYFEHIRSILSKNNFNPPLKVFDLEVKPQEVLFNYRKSNFTEYMTYHIYHNMENNIINTKKTFYKLNEFIYKI